MDWLTGSESRNRSCQQPNRLAFGQSRSPRTDSVRVSLHPPIKVGAHPATDSSVLLHPRCQPAHRLLTRQSSVLGSATESHQCTMDVPRIKQEPGDERVSPALPAKADPESRVLASPAVKQEPRGTPVPLMSMLALTDWNREHAAPRPSTEKSAPPILRCVCPPVVCDYLLTSCSRAGTRRSLSDSVPSCTPRDTFLEQTCQQPLRQLLQQQPLGLLLWWQPSPAPVEWTQYSPYEGCFCPRAGQPSGPQPRPLQTGNSGCSKSGHKPQRCPPSQPNCQPTSSSWACRSSTPQVWPHHGQPLSRRNATAPWKRQRPRHPPQMGQPACDSAPVQGVSEAPL
jgi:hypothetical protein